MTVQFDHKVISSFVIWLNYILAKKGEAYYNFGSKFYPSNQRFNGYVTYSAPFSQLVYDKAITGASLPTGLYLNSTFIVPGQSGFAGVNFEKGEAYFTGAFPSTVNVSGNYAIKDFNVVLSSEPEEKIIFEKQLNPRPKYTQVPTGVLNDELTYPIIFIKNNRRINDPFALGGMDNSKYSLSAYIFADTRFKLDGAVGILCDTARGAVPVLDQSQMPFNSSGLYVSGHAVPFNYTGVAATVPASNYLYIKEVRQGGFSKFSFQEANKLNPDVHFDFVDFELEIPRYPRL